jgi:hypothetical protein
MGLLGIFPEDTLNGYENTKKLGDVVGKLAKRLADFKYLHNL